MGQRLSLQPVTFAAHGRPTIQLEGVYYHLEGSGEWPAAVVCHPHPLMGGTMHNAVVTAMARALVARGIAALRFNFRGTGGSQGRHAFGRGEQDDVAGALDWLVARPGVDPWRISVAGYSFGAWVGVMQAQGDSRVAAVAAVGLGPIRPDADYVPGALPPRASDWDLALLQSFTRPKLFVAGELDTLAPPAVLRPLFDRLPEPKRTEIISGADHSFHGHEHEVGELVAEFLASNT